LAKPTRHSPDNSRHDHNLVVIRSVLFHIIICIEPT
jgi:hypothetical protein